MRLQYNDIIVYYEAEVKDPPNLLFLPLLERDLKYSICLWHCHCMHISENNSSINCRYSVTLPLSKRNEMDMIFSLLYFLIFNKVMLWFGDSLSKVMPWIKEHILEFWMVILISGTSSGFRLIGDKSGGDQVTKKRTRGGLVFSTLSGKMPYF